MNRRRLALAGLLVSACLAAWVASPAAVSARAGLPSRLTDQEFWGLIEDFSEPNGFFRSDNLVSNEDTFQFVIPELLKTTRPGGAYLGVGPDQNFTYIVALQPRIAFITDIRRGNLHEHLMYKALLEQSADRADFLSRLFSRKRPDGLSAASSVDQLFAAYARVEASEPLYQQNLKAMLAKLSAARGAPLSDDDVAGITYVYASFFSSGPSLSYNNSGNGPADYGRPPLYPSYRDLQVANDNQGQQRAYLATEENFRVLKALEANNLIVPIVGNFAGPKALRAVGAYLRNHGATVTAFYASNVEQYLFQDGIWGDFSGNLASLPLDDTSTLIRSCFNNCSSPTGSRAVSLLDSMTGLLRDVRSGKIQTYWDVLAHSHSLPEGVR